MTKAALFKHITTAIEPDKILGVATNASTAEISRQFRKYAKVFHPDKSSNSDRLAFDKLTAAYEKLKRRVPQQLLLHPYHNHQTFLYLENSLSIPEDKLLILDNYAFNVDELVENAQRDIKNFYRNPHVTDHNENNSFSEAAITKLRLHPVLSQHAKTLDRQLATQAHGISKNTVDAVLTLVKEFDKNRIAGSALAKYNFHLYFETLGELEKQKLNQYIINIKTRTGGKMSLPFAAAVIGGNRFDQCIIIARLYLWQFVIDFRPAEMSNLPADIVRKARRRHLQIQPETPNLSQPRLQPISPPVLGPEPPTNMMFGPVSSTVTTISLVNRSLFNRDEAPWSNPHNLATLELSIVSEQLGNITAFNPLALPFNRLALLSLLSRFANTAETSTPNSRRP